ncbi:DNA primase [bacterium]|nr:DNA primase [bacterium]
METKFSIPQNKIEEVRYASDIHDVVAEYVMLKKKGINYFGLCPFHSEKTPSFSINTEKQIFHCFGCGAGGGVINFIMKIENLSFPEAIKFLADKKGIEIRMKPETKKDQEEAKEIDSIYLSLKKASEIYQMNLISDAGKGARDYLEARGISDEIRSKFKLGFAKESWDDLSFEFQRSKIPTKIAENAGLIVSKKGSGFYDRFRGRIMFPVFNLRGQVIAFGGRIFKTDVKDEPKYLNSPETRVYKKRYVLYGLNFSGAAIRKEKSVILVEGYFDFISLFACGIENVAATSGTSLTNEHAMLIKRYTDNVYLFFDPDFAGVQASFRGIELLLSHGFSINIASLPEGDDPDSYARKHGRDGIMGIIKKAKLFMEFFIERKVMGINLDSPKEQLKCILEVKPMINQLQNQIEKMKYIESLSFMLKVDKSIVIDEITKGTSTKKRKSMARPLIEKDYTKDEQEVLGVITSEFEKIDPELIENINPDYFKSAKIRDAYLLFMSKFSKPSETSKQVSFDELPDGDSKRLILETLSMDWSEFNKSQTLLDFIEKGKKSLLHKESKNLSKKLQKTKNDQNFDEDNLLREKIDLIRKIHGIGE